MIEIPEILKDVFFVEVTEAEDATISVSLVKKDNVANEFIVDHEDFLIFSDNTAPSFLVTPEEMCALLDLQSAIRCLMEAQE